MTHLSTMTCDICKKRYLVRPSKYGPSTYYMSDFISFSRCNTKGLDVGGDTYQIHVCPGCFTDVIKLVSSTYDLDNMKARVKHWENQMKRHEKEK